MYVTGKHYADNLYISSTVHYKYMRPMTNENSVSHIKQVLFNPIRIPRTDNENDTVTSNEPDTDLLLAHLKGPV